MPAKSRGGRGCEEIQRLPDLCLATATVCEPTMPVVSLRGAVETDAYVEVTFSQEIQYFAAECHAVDLHDDPEAHTRIDLTAQFVGEPRDELRAGEERLAAVQHHFVRHHRRDCTCCVPCGQTAGRAWAAIRAQRRDVEKIARPLRGHGRGPSGGLVGLSRLDGHEVRGRRCGPR